MQGLRILATLAVLGLGSVASSAVLFDGGTPDHVEALRSSGGDVAASRFTLPLGGIVSEATFYGLYYPENTPADDDFAITVYSDLSGRPGTVLASRSTNSLSRSDAGTSTFGPPDYQYGATFENIYLSAGTYWLALHDLAPGDGNSWYWLTSASAGRAAASANNGIDWQAEPTLAMAFQVGGVVPEPTIAGGLLLGATILASRRKREAAAK